jgi:hypothetical protein
VDLTTGGSLGGDDERIKEKRERGSDMWTSQRVVGTDYEI